ncbi:MAG: PTS sugar transporter subunit IIC [Mycoplasmatales bacterium]|nr:PTS sugar transporter subunit IIC [Mycoplasmatales bacterium]
MKNWFQNRFIPTVGKLGNQRHLATIRDAFAIFTPIIIVGAFAVLWRNVLFVPWGGKGNLTGLWTSFNEHAVSGKSYKEFLTVLNHMMLYIQVGTINVMSIYVAFGIGYFLARSRNSNTPIIAGLVSIASFFAMTNMMISGTWESGMYWLGARGLITAIIFGLLSTELFVWLSKGDKLAIKMPEGVPPAVSRAFAKLFPAILTVMAAGLANLLIWMPFHFMKATLIEGTKSVYTIDPNIPNPTDAQAQLLLDGKLGFNPNDIKDLKWNKIEIKDLASAKLWLKDLVNNKDAAAKLVNVDSPTGEVGSRTFAAILEEFGNHVTTSVVDNPVTGGDVTMTAAIFAGVVNPFISVSSKTSGALGIALLYVLLVSFFWFFGLHGTNIVNGAFNPLWLILYANNINGASNVFVQGTFDAYIFIGGWGATLALVIATLIFGNKKSPEYEIAKFAFAPSVFQINEPVTFGYPLVLNMFLVIPLFLVMPILVITTFFGIEYFGVPKVTVLIPWTMPVGFGGLVASGSAWGFVLAIVNLLIATAIWTPFVLIMRGKNKNIETASSSEKTVQIEKTNKAKISIT